MSIDRHYQLSQRHTSTAIDYAPLEDILGEKLASEYVIRELTVADGIHFHDRGSRLLRTTKNRTYNLAIGVVHRDTPKLPLVSLIASKYQSESKTLTVHATQARLSGVSSDVGGKLVHSLLLATQIYDTDG